MFCTHLLQTTEIKAEVLQSQCMQTHTNMEIHHEIYVWR